MEATDAICGGGIVDGVIDGVVDGVVDGVADLEPEPEPEPELGEIGDVETCKRLRTSDESSTEALEQVTDSSNADLADSHNNVCNIISSVETFKISMKTNLCNMAFL